jgi:hypothetical protein
VPCEAPESVVVAAAAAAAVRAGGPDHPARVATGQAAGVAHGAAAARSSATATAAHTRHAQELTSALKGWFLHH